MFSPLMYNMKSEIWNLRYEILRVYEHQSSIIFCHLSSVFSLLPGDALYICRESSTNQPFFCKTNPISPIFRLKMKILLKNKANTNPIQTQSKPILGQFQGWQTQTNPIQSQSSLSSVCACSLFCRGTNPVLSEVEWANFVTTQIGISQIHCYLANGSVSGTTLICVVNLYGIPIPLSKLSSTKNAVQPLSGSATFARYLPLPRELISVLFQAFPIVSSRKSRVFSFVACHNFTAFGFVFVLTAIAPSTRTLQLNSGSGAPRSMAA